MRVKLGLSVGLSFELISELKREDKGKDGETHQQNLS